MQISPYFERSEFACKCGCGFATVDAELLNVLNKTRVYFNKPVTITSAARCAAHNTKVGSTEASQHRLGTAADIQIKDILPIDVAEFLMNSYPEQYGIGQYVDFTHIDVRTTKARW